MPVTHYPDIEDFYQMFADGVQFAPVVRDANGDSIKCKRPNTFVVLPKDDKSMIESDHFGMIPRSQRAPLFYSREWESTGRDPNKVSWTYPLVGMFESSSYFENYFGQSVSQKYSEMRYTFQIWVADQYKPTCCENGTGSSCDRRTPDEIKYDCTVILRQLARYVASCQRYTYEQGGEIRRRWLHPLVAERLTELGKIPSLNLDRCSTTKYENILRSQAQMSKSYIIEDYTQKCLWGRGMFLTLVVGYCDEYTPFVTDACVEQVYRSMCC